MEYTKEQINKCECTCDECGAECEPFWKKENKKQIMIDGRKRDCKILFRCKHIDDTAACDMMCEGIEITPENAPVSDFELMLIEDTCSPFGFSFVCKRNNKEDVWEHSGFGNSGACSIVTALLKQFTCKTQECEVMEIAIKIKDQRIEDYRNALDNKTKQLNRYKEAFNEIKSIVSSTLDCGEWIGQGDNKMENILDIINKAKKGE